MANAGIRSISEKKYIMSNNQLFLIAINKEIVKQTLYNQNILFDFHIGRKTSYSTLNITAVIMTAREKKTEFIKIIHEILYFYLFYILRFSSG